jgi:hypothetical protein
MTSSQSAQGLEVSCPQSSLRAEASARHSSRSISRAEIA